MGRPVYKLFLVVPRRCQAQMDARAALDLPDRNEVRVLGIRAPGRDAVDLGAAVRSEHVAPRRVATGPAAHDDDIALPVRPFALCSEQPLARVEDQVVAAAVTDRAVDIDPEPDGRGGDRRLRDRSLLVGRQLHDTNTSSCLGRIACRPDARRAAAPRADRLLPRGRPRVRRPRARGRGRRPTSSSPRSTPSAPRATCSSWPAARARGPDGCCATRPASPPSTRRPRCWRSPRGGWAPGASGSSRPTSSRGAPTASYDAVFFGFWLSHVPLERFERFWALVADCLAPGGRVCFVDDAHRTADELIEGEASSTIRRRLNDGSVHRAVKVPARSRRAPGSAGRPRLEHHGGPDVRPVLLGRGRPERRKRRRFRPLTSPLRCRSIAMTRA